MLQLNYEMGGNVFLKYILDSKILKNVKRANLSIDPLTY